MSKHKTPLIKVEEAKKIVRVFPKESAGRKMISGVPIVKMGASIADVESALLAETKKLETINYIYLVDDDKKLKGVISIKEVFKSPKNIRVDNLIKKILVKVDPYTDQEKVVQLALKHGLKAIPVVDKKNRFLGIVPSDKILRILHEESTEDILQHTGTYSRGTEIIDAPTMKVAEARLPWLLVGILGGVVSGSIIGIFKPALESLLVLSVYIPVMMNSGGNVGNQSATIFIKNLSLGRITNVTQYFLKEIKVGLIIGFICAAVLSLVGLFWQGSAVIGLIVGLAMFLTLIFATLIGIFIPWMINKLNLDPATGTSPFITTVQDVVSLLIYFSIASSMLGYL